jgi:hypothetical protein
MKTIQRNLDYGGDRGIVPVIRQVEDDYKISPLGGHEDDIPFTEQVYEPKWDEERKHIDDMNTRNRRYAQQVDATLTDPTLKGIPQQAIDWNYQKQLADMQARQLEHQFPNDPEMARHAAGIRTQKEEEMDAIRDIAYARWRGQKISPAEERAEIEARKKYGYRKGRKSALPGGQARADTILPIPDNETPEQRLRRKGEEKLRLNAYNPALLAEYRGGQNPDVRANPRRYANETFGGMYPKTDVKGYQWQDFFSQSPDGGYVFDEKKFNKLVPNAHKHLADYYSNNKFNREAFMASEHNPYREQPEEQQIPTVPPTNLGEDVEGPQPYREPGLESPQVMSRKDNQRKTELMLRLDQIKSTINDLRLEPMVDDNGNTMQLTREQEEERLRNIEAAYAKEVDDIIKELGEIRLRERGS